MCPDLRKPSIQNKPTKLRHHYSLVAQFIYRQYPRVASMALWLHIVSHADKD